MSASCPLLSPLTWPRRVWICPFCICSSRRSALGFPSLGKMSSFHLTLLHLHSRCWATVAALSWIFSVFFHVPLEAEVPKLQLWMHQCWEKEVHGARGLSHSLVLWANAWCRHHCTSIPISTADCQRGLNSWYKLGETEWFWLQLQLWLSISMNFPCLLSKSEQSPTYSLLFLKFIFQSKTYQNIVLHANFLPVNPLLYVIHPHQAVYMEG